MDNKPWISTSGFRTAEQAWHPVYGLSTFRPRCDVHGITDCSPLLNGCPRLIQAHNARDRKPSESPR